MEPIAPTTFTNAPAASPDLQKAVARSAAGGNPDNSVSTSDVPDTITLGNGVIPSLAVVTKQLQREMEYEARQAAQRAEENAREEQLAEQQKAERAQLDNAAQAKSDSPDIQKASDSGSAQPQSTAAVGSRLQTGILRRDPPRIAPTRAAGHGVPAHELLNRVKSGLQHVSPQQLSTVHRLNFSIRA